MSEKIDWKRRKVAEDEISAVWQEYTKLETQSEFENFSSLMDEDSFWPKIVELAEFCDEILEKTTSLKLCKVFGMTAVPIGGFTQKTRLPRHRMVRRGALNLVTVLLSDVSRICLINGSRQPSASDAGKLSLSVIEENVKAPASLLSFLK